MDLDDCATGPRVQDLWMLLSGSRSDQRRQWAELLEGYTQFADFDFGVVGLIEPLRTLRMLHHAAWVSHRWRDPAFPRAFPWFGEHCYWEGYVGDLREQLETLERPATGGGGARLLVVKMGTSHRALVRPGRGTFRGAGA